MIRLLKPSVAVAAIAAALAAPGWAGTPVDLGNFTEQTYATGLGQITGLAWAASGGNNYLFVANRTGTIRVIRNGTLQATSYGVASPCNSGTNGECGLESIVVDPNFSSNGYLYLYVIESGDGTSGGVATDGAARIRRFTSTTDGSGNLVGSNYTAIGPVLPTRGMNHNGGGMSIGPDNNLYFGVGNLNNGVNRGGNSSAEVNTSLGSKIGRMTLAGSAVATNPMYNAGDGITATDYIFARGMRNPFGLRHHPTTGDLWLTQVGDGWEQIFLVPSNGNVGWPTENNTSTTNGLLIPKFAYNTGGSIGNCLTRGVFYNGTAFPASHQGNFFFCDYGSGRIMRAPVSGNVSLQTPSEFVTGGQNPTDIVVGPDGALYYAASGAGAVRRVYYSGGNVAPAITSQPGNQTVNDGQSATFSAAASGNPAPAFQWQRSTDGGATWSNIAGATGTSYSTGAATLAMSGQRFRAVATNVAGSATSNAATLTVNPVAPTVTGQPANQTVVEGSTATFSATAAGSAPLTYQWQLSTDNGATWNNIGGATSTSYTTPAATLAMSGYRYRVVVDNGAPGTVNSNSATLTVNSAPTAPVITQAPVAQTVTAPATATFTVTAGGTAPLAYQWQRSTDGGTTWTNVGLSLASYTTPATTTAMTGDLYRVVVSNGLGSATSASAVLTVNGPPAATPLIVPNGGTYTGPVTVRMSTASAGAEIRYTTNGTTPAAGSTLYAGPFTVSTTSTVQARAMGTGYSPSAVASAVFTINGTTAYGLPYRDPVAGLTVPPQQSGLPATLSGTGIFTNVGAMTPAAGLIPFSVNSPLWSDGAAKQRWIALPGASQIVFSATDEWTFPTGTVLVKHFDLQTSPGVFRRVETRVLRTDGAGSGYGSTYRWRLDGSDADLVTASATEVINVGGVNQTWFYPAPSDCLRCHTTQAGFVLGPKTRQLNGVHAYPGGTSDNQIRTWSYLEMFTTRVNEAQIPGFQRLRALTDATATLEDRVKSYLDSNCAHCHRGPSTPAGRAQFDGRYATPMASQGIVDALPLADALGIANARIVAPQDVGRSLMHSRMQRTDTNRMPPLASSVPDAEALLTFEAWINTLPLTPPPVAITAAPTTQSVTDGQTATFSVDATGAPPLSYQWQQSTNGGATWTDIPGATGPTLTVAATAAMDGTLYRVVVTDGTGATATSGAATLNVGPAPPPPVPLVAGPQGDPQEGLDEKCLGGIAAPAPGLPWLWALLAFAYRGRWRRR